MAKPLGSLTVSGAPLSPATVENLKKSGVFFPTLFKKLALVKAVTSSVTSKTPCAAEPLA